MFLTLGESEVLLLLFKLRVIESCLEIAVMGVLALPKSNTIRAMGIVFHHFVLNFSFMRSEFYYCCNGLKAYFERVTSAQFVLCLNAETSGRGYLK